MFGHGEIGLQEGGGLCILEHMIGCGTVVLVYKDSVRWTCKGCGSTRFVMLD